MSVAGIVMGAANDIEQVIRRGDSWTCIPRNTLAKVLSTATHHTGIWALGLLTVPMGGVVGAVVMQMVASAAIATTNLFVVRAVAFQGKREMEVAAAAALMKRVEEMRRWEKEAQVAIDAGRPITDDVFASDPEEYATLFKEPWRWSKKNKDVVYLMGVAAIVYGVGFSTAYWPILHAFVPSSEKVIDDLLTMRII